MKNLSKFSSEYPSPRGQLSFIHRAPIGLLSEVIVAAKEDGVKIRVRYRGPRAHTIGKAMYSNGMTYYRSDRQAYQDCLKEDATSFSVYMR